MEKLGAQKTLILVIHPGLFGLLHIRYSRLINEEEVMMNPSYWHSVCKSCLNRRVRIETRYGDSYEGQIVHVDDHYVYLQVDEADARAFLPQSYNPFFNQTVLPLVLFNLLTISLLN